MMSENPPSTALPRIGPGLGCRSRIWMRVYNRLYNNPEMYADPLPAKEKLLLQQLAFPNANPAYSTNPNAIWLSFIPSEYVDIYYAIYDEMKVLPIAEKEVIKVDKDVPRTYGLFARNSKLLRLQFPDMTNINIATDLSKTGNGETATSSSSKSNKELSETTTTIIRSSLLSLLKSNTNIMTAYYISLKNILLAISYERGYCQGINFIVASLLIHFPYEREVYTIVAYLLKYRFVGILFDPKYSSLLDYIRIFEKKLRKHNRRIYRHFKKTEFTAVSYTIEWFTTCFIVSSPGELSLCVLDMLIAGFDNIMLKIGLSLLDYLEETLLALDFEALHSTFKTLTLQADPIAVMARALCIDIGTSNNLLKDMAQKIESIDPSANGNLKFSRLSTMKIVSQDNNGLDTSMNTSFEQIGGQVNQSPLRSEDDINKYADDEAPHHPIANPDTSLIHSSLLPKHQSMKTKRRKRNDHVRRMKREEKRQLQKPYEDLDLPTAVIVGSYLPNSSSTQNAVASTPIKPSTTTDYPMYPEANLLMTPKPSNTANGAPGTATTIKHIDNYSPLSPPPPPSSTPVNKANPSLLEQPESSAGGSNGMWGSFVGSMSKLLSTPSRKSNKETDKINTTPHHKSTQNSTASHGYNTPQRLVQSTVPISSSHHKQVPNFAPSSSVKHSAATQSLLFSPTYNRGNMVPTPNKPLTTPNLNTSSSRTSIQRKGHVVVQRNLQTYSIHGTSESSSDGDDDDDIRSSTSSASEENGTANSISADNVGVLPTKDDKLFVVSPLRYKNKKLMSFLYHPHPRQQKRQHHHRHCHYIHKDQNRYYLHIAGFCVSCGCVDIEDDYEGDAEPLVAIERKLEEEQTEDQTSSSASSCYFHYMQRKHTSPSSSACTNVILFSEEGDTIICNKQSSRNNNQLAIKSYASTNVNLTTSQSIIDQGGEVIPLHFYLNNHVIEQTPIFESWFNSTGKRVSSGNRMIRKKTWHYNSKKHKEELLQQSGGVNQAEKKYITSNTSKLFLLKKFHSMMSLPSTSTFAYDDDDEKQPSI